jgi:nucleotide-binding universal stress UspA family protein
MKTILVPTDHSAEARNALIYALEMALHTKAEIILLHVFHQQIPLSASLDLEEYIGHLEEKKTRDQEQYAQHMQEELSKDFAFQFHTPQEIKGNDLSGYSLTPGGFHYLEALPHAEALATLPIKTVAKFGDSSQKILEAIQTYSADLVIMGMRGARTMGRALLGSVVTEVMLRANVPVLAVPLSRRYQGLSTIVFAIDLKTQPDPQHLAFLQALAQQYSATLQLLHLYQEDKAQELEHVQESLLQLDTGLAAVSFTVFFKASNNVLEAIEQFTADQQADMLVVAPHKHSYLDIILKKSITGTLSAHVGLPLLTLPSSLTAYTQDSVSSYPKTQESF